MANFGARNIQQLRSALIAAERQVTNSSSFQPFYLFAFKFCLTVSSHDVFVGRCVNAMHMKHCNAMLL